MHQRVLFLSSLTLLISGCQWPNQQLDFPAQVSQAVKTEQAAQQTKAEAVVACQDLCQTVAISDVNRDPFANGPCLSNAIAPDWVCDVAHKPRQAVDDEAANQCAAFRSGTAHHFIEVDGNCNVIKVQ